MNEHTHQPTPAPFPLGPFALAGTAMALVVLASNILVQFAINDWLTWGAITYPVAFLVSELVNRAHGPGQARRVAWVGFAVAVAASLVLAPVRIAVASGTAFLLSQWLDIAVFDRLRRGSCAASSVTDSSPDASRARIARRVGSARAEKVALRGSGVIQGTGKRGGKCSRGAG